MKNIRMTFQTYKLISQIFIELKQIFIHLLSASRQSIRVTFVWISNCNAFKINRPFCKRTKGGKKNICPLLKRLKEMQFYNCNIGIIWQWVHSIVTTVCSDNPHGRGFENLKWISSMSKWNGRTSFILQYFTANSTI